MLEAVLHGPETHSHKSALPHSQVAILVTRTGQELNP
jgi:hypothetical protein